jgi:hypothetical protein
VRQRTFGGDGSARLALAVGNTAGIQAGENGDDASEAMFVSTILIFLGGCGGDECKEGDPVPCPPNMVTSCRIRCGTEDRYFCGCTCKNKKPDCDCSDSPCGGGGIETPDEPDVFVGRA